MPKETNVLQKPLGYINTSNLHKAAQIYWGFQCSDKITQMQQEVLFNGVLISQVRRDIVWPNAKTRPQITLCTSFQL